MLIPLAFLLLLAHFPPLQGTTSMRKNSTGVNQPTPHTIALNIPKPITTFAKPKNQSPAIDTTSSKVNQTLTSTKPALVQKKPKDKPAPNPQPIKVIISEGCLQKEPVKAAVNSTKTQETELILKPGSPLVMTHRINLVPTACTGGCEAEMAALKGRVEFLEEQVSSLKTKCSACSGLKCPNDCSKQGKCEGGKCICQQGFIGIDCSTSTCPSNCNRKGKCVKGKCVCQPGYTGPDCGKGGDKRIKVTVETVTMKKVSSEAGTLKEGTSSGKKTKPDKTIFLKKKEDKDQKKDSTTKQTVKAESTKTSTKQGVKTTTVKVQSNDTRSGKVVKTIGQILLKHQGERRQEQATKGKTTIMKVSSEKITKPDVKKVGIKLESKRQSPKDQPAKENVTSNVLVSTAKGTSLNVTVSGTKVIKTAQTQGGNVTVKSTGRATSPTRNSTKLMGIGSVKVHNITSSGFILTWEAPQGTFKNFTVSRREFQKGSDEKEEEDIEEAAKIQDVEEKVTEKANVAWNVTEVQKQSSNRTLSSKPHSVSKGKGDSKSLKTFSQVLAGTARSFHFRNLRSLTRYSISLFGSSSGSRSKIHRLTISTGPEPPTELIFSNVTETSFSVSWTKPKSTVTGFRVTYTNSANGETGSMLVDSQRYHASLSKLLPGSTYDIKVSSLLETAESESVTATIVTVPDSPLNLQAINITDTKAVLTWKPAQAKVDRYILSYSSTKSPNVTVTVMVSGSAEEHHLRGLHKSTIYTVKAMSQVNSLQSSIVSTSFTTSSGVKLKTVTPAEVTYNSAVISWKAPKLTVKSYRLTYQLEGQMAKEVIISPTITRYELTELQVSSNYTVKVEGERDGQYIIISSTEFTTGKLPYPFPSDCSEVQLNGVQKSGETEVYPHGQDGEPFWVYCDMETDGGGWTVFQRRMNGKTDFYRGWKDYSKGFGHLSEEFWLGNDLLHSLTSLKPMSLRVDLRAGNDTAYSHYSNFSIDSEANNYTIELFGYSGTAGDSMRYHHGRPFSTRDKDPIPLSIHCAKAYMGGWWYKNCYKANLNGLYATFSENQGVVWIDWKGKDTSIPFTEMKLRPASFSQTTMG